MPWPVLLLILSSIRFARTSTHRRGRQPRAPQPIPSAPGALFFFLPHCDKTSQTMKRGTLIYHSSFASRPKCSKRWSWMFESFSESLNKVVYKLVNYCSHFVASKVNTSSIKSRRKSLDNIVSFLGAHKEKIKNLSVACRFLKCFWAWFKALMARCFSSAPTAAHTAVRKSRT